MSGEKPLLPSLAAILCAEKNTSEPCSPLLETMNTSFCSDSRGIIRLPPLNGGISRPASVDSAMRQTVAGGVQPVDDNFSRIRTRSFPEYSQLNVTPSTPVVKKKFSGHPSKKNDMLTPLSAARAIITPSANDKKRAFAFITHSKETFPTKEPKIDNAPLARRKRRRTSTQELNILQAEFDACSAPDKKKRQELAERCNMSEKAVQIWFQNRRQAIKKQRNAAANKARAVALTASAVVSGPGLALEDTSASAKPKPMDMSIEPSVTDLAESSKKSFSEGIIESTPIASKCTNTLQTGANTPVLRLPSQEQREAINKNGQINGQGSQQQQQQQQQQQSKLNPRESCTPTRSSQQCNIKRGQALTFHLTSDKKILTPLKISPNNRVNKLINGANSGSPCNRTQTGVPPATSMVKMELTPTKKNPLKEINTNTLVR